MRGESTAGWPTQRYGISCTGGIVGKGGGEEERERESYIRGRKGGGAAKGRGESG